MAPGLLKEGGKAENSPERFGPTNIVTDHGVVEIKTETSDKSAD